MSIDLHKDRGVPVEKQRFTWRDILGKPRSKLNQDAFTLVRIILMNGIEAEAVRFQHSAARMCRTLREPLALIRRIEHHQQSLVHWLLPTDITILETTLGFEQVAIEVTSHAAMTEPDPYLAQVYRFGTLEDFDHLYRYASLADRVEGKDPNTIIQSYTDMVPGRPTSVEHRYPLDDLRLPYERIRAAFMTKLNAYTITAAEHMTHDYYMTVGPSYPDPMGRLLYAEIASIEEQHVTQYESLMDPDESVLEKWLMHEVTEIYNYYSCLQYEVDPQVKKVWERCLDYELGQLRFVANLFENIERRDIAEVLPKQLPEPVAFESHREFVRHLLRTEVDLSSAGTTFVHRSQETPATRAYRAQLNSEGSPSNLIAAEWRWRPGTELTAPEAPMSAPRPSAELAPQATRETPKK